jgi:hypothetical protein
LEDDFQRALYTLHNITTEFGTEISPLKSKVMAFTGQVPIRSKTVINNIVLEQENTFTYFGCKISYEEEKGHNFKHN